MSNLTKSGWVAFLFVVFLSATLPTNQISAVTMIPGANATGIDPSTFIIYQFEQPMNPLSFNDRTFTVSGSISGWHSGLIVYDTLLANAVFWPNQPFRTGELITVTLTNELQAANGSFLETGYCWSFTISDGPADHELRPGRSYPVGDWPGNVAAVDVDADGDLDAVVGHRSQVELSACG
jgi:hypothetical protein